MSLVPACQSGAQIAPLSLALSWRRRETAISKHIRGPFATPSDEETMAKSISETLSSKYPHM